MKKINEKINELLFQMEEILSNEINFEFKGL